MKAPTTKRPENNLEEMILIPAAKESGPGGDGKLGVVPWHAGAARECGFVAPHSEMEKAVSEVWAKVLGHSGGGLHDNFFEIGGHSLGATRVTARLREMFHVRLSIRSVFEKPTIAELSREIERLRSRNEPEVGGGIQRAVRVPYAADPAIKRPLKAAARGVQ